MSKSLTGNQAHFINRFRFWGIRALNWTPMPDDFTLSQVDHADKTDCALWQSAAPINIIIGPNGGGKTTVLDLVRALDDPDLWPSLPRENPRGKYFSGFQIEGDNWKLWAEFKDAVSDEEDAGFRLRQFTIYPQISDVHTDRGWMSFYGRDDQEDESETAEWKRRIKACMGKARTPKVCYCEPPGQNPEAGNPEIIAILNDIWPSLQGVDQLGVRQLNIADVPFKIVGKGSRVGVALSDDPAQPQHLNVEHLPLGWRHYAHVIWFLRNAPTNSIVVLDEPDRVLHPRLQRRLLQEIAAIAKDRHQQLFIATHSPALVNPALIEPLGAKVFRVGGHRLTELTDRRDVLDDLGHSSADLAQANGVIWVEGPTDRIYINTWLRLFAEHTGKEPWIEGLNYQIAFYGGALLKYLTLLDAKDATSDRVSIRSINRNAFVVMDADGDVVDCGIDASTAKGKLLDEAQLIADRNAGGMDRAVPAWVTEFYTIENYLPAPYDQWVEVTNEGRTRIVGRKITLADRFRTAGHDWKDSYRLGCDLPAKIEALFGEIESWQSTDKVELVPMRAADE
ncbi:ATP-binding protein [Rhizobium leguminosarum bv. viciae]|uniref:ATP-dependent nuclease n=1 Tax=Rhizobium leguminosarum TaxID=384 RepID=UPI0010403467|nr:AAA family ATPase [Rhizobium leguminosarum]TBY66243.1 ATP-binding protein [Rhizobium leguminosarum bv. viciae]